MRSKRFKKQKPLKCGQMRADAQNFVMMIESEGRRIYLIQPEALALMKWLRGASK